MHSGIAGEGCEKTGPVENDAAIQNALEYLVGVARALKTSDQSSSVKAEMLRLEDEVGAHRE